jgi:peptidoglycan-associated lipoprotein
VYPVRMVFKWGVKYHAGRILPCVRERHAGCMRTICLSLGLLFALFLEGCHHPRLVVDGLPLAPAPIKGPDGAEPERPPVESNTPSMSPTTLPAPKEPGLMKYSLNDLLLELVDAYFGLDQHALGEDARAALHADASILKTIVNQSPDTTMLIEGHCDERGSAEYNLALGAMRAEAAKEFLIEVGVPNAVLKTISYGKERPQCTTQTEECWQKNRRAHLAPE